MQNQFNNFIVNKSYWLIRFESAIWSINQKLKNK